MKIAVTTSSDEFELGGIKGGNQLIMETITNAINKYTKHNATNIFLPSKHYPLTSLFKSYYKYYRTDFSEYDLVISSKYPSYVIRHKDHICFFAHRFRQFYDWWPDYKKSIQGYGNKAITYGARLLIKKIDSHFLKKAKKIYAYSKFLKARLEQSGIKSELLYAPSPIEKFGQGMYDYILSPSILDDSRKRISLIIEAMKHIKGRIKLKIAGDGPHRKMLRELAKKDKRIEFLGFQNSENLAKLYANALCVPFVSYLEDYGLVTIEAMKSKKPVITCKDSGGPLEFVQHNKTGLISEPNPKEIASKINYLINNPQEARRMGREGYKIVKDITWKNTIRKLLNLY